MSKSSLDRIPCFLTDFALCGAGGSAGWRKRKQLRRVSEVEQRSAWLHWQSTHCTPLFKCFSITEIFLMKLLYLDCILTSPPWPLPTCSSLHIPPLGAMNSRDDKQRQFAYRAAVSDSVSKIGKVLGQTVGECSAHCLRSLWTFARIFCARCSSLLCVPVSVFWVPLWAASADALYRRQCPAQSDRYLLSLQKMK